MADKKLKLKVAKRCLKTLAAEAIKNDFMKGLIELITNSDDSYSRQEMRGHTTSGRITITVERRPRKKETLLCVQDWAEGMDAKDMELQIAQYGEYTSGHAGRGIFGMGLKDTINAFGLGSIHSIKDGIYYSCSLENIEDFLVKEPQHANSDLRKKFNIAEGNGTLILIRITNPQIRIPQYEKLRKNLQTHVCLRLIMRDAKRTVTLIDQSTGRRDTLRYEDPDHTILLEKEITLPSFPQARALLRVCEASSSEPLTQQGSYRTGGILLVSVRTVHQATLFDYDNEPSANKLFGVLRCDYIYELQLSDQEYVVKRDRSGLDPSHPFCRSLADACKAELAQLIEVKRKEVEEQKKQLESERTRRRFQAAIRDLNRIALKELEESKGGGRGAGAGLGPGPARLPLDGFEFIPDDYVMVVAEKQRLKLRTLPDVVPLGEAVEIGCDAAGIEVKNAIVLVPEKKENQPYCVTEVLVEGIKPGAEGIVTAKYNGKTALAIVKVVSERRTRTSSSSGTFFKEIKYERLDLPPRARFDRQTGIIWINTGAASVALYFGPNGEGEEDAANMVLTAELVTELACQEIALEKERKGSLDIPPGINKLGAYYNEINRLKDTYAVTIHRAVVSPISWPSILPALEAV